MVLIIVLVFIIIVFVPLIIQKNIQKRHYIDLLSEEGKGLLIKKNYTRLSLKRYRIANFLRGRTHKLEEIPLNSNNSRLHSLNASVTELLKVYANDMNRDYEIFSLSVWTEEQKEALLRILEEYNAMQNGT